MVSYSNVHDRIRNNVGGIEMTVINWDQVWKGYKKTCPYSAMTVRTRKIIEDLVNKNHLEVEVRFETPERHTCATCKGKGYIEDVQAKLL